MLVVKGVEWLREKRQVYILNTDSEEGLASALLVHHTLEKTAGALATNNLNVLDLSDVDWQIWEDDDSSHDGDVNDDIDHNDVDINLEANDSRPSSDSTAAEGDDDTPKETADRSLKSNENGSRKRASEVTSEACFNNKTLTGNEESDNENNAKPTSDRDDFAKQLHENTNHTTLEDAVKNLVCKATDGQLCIIADEVDQ